MSHIHNHSRVIMLAGVQCSATICTSWTVGFFFLYIDWALFWVTYLFSSDLRAWPEGREGRACCPWTCKHHNFKIETLAKTIMIILTYGKCKNNFETCLDMYFTQATRGCYFDIALLHNYVFSRCLISSFFSLSPSQGMLIEGPPGPEGPAVCSLFFFWVN